MNFNSSGNDLSSISTKSVEESAGLDWQVDSDWIDFSSSSTPSGSPIKKENKQNSPRKSKIKFHFVPNSKGGRYMIVNHQALRLSQRTASGFSYWVCNIPTCNAQCILDPEERKVTRYNGEHNHDSDVASRIVFRHFINALKLAVKENPHVKPKMIYEKEFKRIKEEWENSKSGKNSSDQLCLPNFDDVKTAMYNTRNVILSAFSLRPTEESKIEEKSSAGPSRSTRSKDAFSTPKKKSMKSESSQDMKELEDVWASQAHKDASLSDFEDWLDEDADANISHIPVKSKANSSTTSLHSELEEDAEQKMGMEFSHDKDEDLWNASNPLGKIPRRKYRKRPASMSVFTCPYCPYKSNRHFNVQRHERLAHSSKKPEFSCKECGTSYSLEYRLKLHIKAVHQGEGHHCHICSRTFETMTGLKSHLVTKHKNEDPSKVPRELPPELTCKLCGRVFTTKAHLLKHTSTHVMVQPYRCYSCNQPFLDECTWLTHQNNCNEAFTIQCCLCSRVIPTAQELLTHMDEVHGRAEYACNCGKSFPWKKSLLTHQQKCSLYLAGKAPAS